MLLCGSVCNAENDIKAHPIAGFALRDSSTQG